AWMDNGAILSVGTHEGQLITVKQKDDSFFVTARTKMSLRKPIVIQKGAPSGRWSMSSCAQDLLCLLVFDESGVLQRQIKIYQLPSSPRRVAWSADGQQ